MSKKLKEMDRATLTAFLEECDRQYADFQAKNIKLDMSRGKPGADQLDLSMGMMDVLSSADILKSGGMDCRNYGLLDGISEAKQLFAEMLEVSAENIFVGGNSSLNLMYDMVSMAMTHGVSENSTPWMTQGKVKFLCPVPGYDRHFAICEHFGIEMINIEMSADGPDMDAVEKLVSEDDSIKGIWCVPLYSNPEGSYYSDETVRRFAKLSPKAEDFRIFWDNAYCVHHLTDEKVQILDIIQECEKNGNPDMVYEFASTSKISFSGAGVGVIATSVANLAQIKKTMTIKTIGYDKINMLRHVKFFKNMDGITSHMEKHREILEPKFKTVLQILEKEIQPLGIGEWISPKGGYFISFNTMNGCAKKVVSLCKDAGVTLTNAGATFPYGRDNLDRNIRIAPTFPPVDELITAMELFCICVKKATCEMLLND